MWWWRGRWSPPPDSQHSLWVKTSLVCIFTCDPMETQEVSDPCEGVTKKRFLTFLCPLPFTFGAGSPAQPSSLEHMLFLLLSWSFLWRWRCRLSRKDFFKLQFNCDIIHIPCKVYDSVVFSLFRVVQPSLLFQNISITSRINYSIAFTSSSFPRPPQPQATTGLCVSMDLPNLGISCKWSHTVYGLSCLTSFT